MIELFNFIIWRIWGSIILFDLSLVDFSLYFKLKSKFHRSEEIDKSEEPMCNQKDDLTAIVDETNECVHWVPSLNLVVKLIEVEIDAEDLERWIGEFKGRAKLKKHRCNEHDHEDDDETVVVHSDLAV